MDSPAALHPTDQTLHAYGLGKLDDDAAARVDSRLEDCPDCRRKVGALPGDSFLGRMRDAGGGPVEATRGRSRSEAAREQVASARASSAPDAVLADLADLKGYEIVRELGRGGMGVVYLARNTMLDRLEVLKVLNKDMLERRGVKERFLREMQAAARLNHANVVGAYAAIPLDQFIVFAMEYVEGNDLAQLVKTRGKLPVAHACFFVYQAALGLQHAHERKMVHRDIKPGNLILAVEGERAVVKVLDFGLAKATREDRVDSSLTQQGQMLGTPDYIAPEQSLDAQKADIRADIYSLGCTLYYLLTGGPPFRGKSLYDILQSHHSVEAKPLNLVRPEVPVELAEIVGKMMAKDADRRFQTPAEVARALKPFFKKGADNSSSGSGVHQVTPEGAEITHEPQGVAAPASGPEVAARTAVPAAAPDRPEEMWKSLIEFKETEHSKEQGAALLGRRPGAPAPWMAWPAVAAASFLGFLALGVIVYVTTDKGHIKIVIDGPKTEVKIDGETVRIEGLGAPVTLRAGKHEMKIRWGDRTFKTREFVVRRGDNEALQVKYEPTPSPDKNSMAVSSPPSSPEDTAAQVQSWTNSIGMRMVPIKPGTFLMGSADDDKEAETNEKPRHEVRISRAFSLGAHEVTQGQYRAVTGKNPSNFKGSDDLPVEQVSWFDAVKFCNALSVKEGLSPFYKIAGNDVTVSDWKGPGYRLPTEAEWEYACRGGKPTRYSFGDDAARLGEYAWYLNNSGNKSHPVGQKRPNAFGLYDMAGNVNEWCWDGYGDYTGLPAVAPTGPLQASPHRVLRGVWLNGARGMRAAFRGHRPPDWVGGGLGFRVARTTTASATSGAGVSATGAGETGKPLVDEPPGPPTAIGYIPLFNGKDLAGWTRVDDQGNPATIFTNWTVKDGVIYGSGGQSHLFSPRGNYKDFRVRAEVKINDGGNSGLFFRTAKGPGVPKGYEAQINSTGRDPKKTGSLYRVPRIPIAVDKSPVPPDTWFTLEVEASGNSARVWVNQKLTVDWTDLDKNRDQGYFALQVHDDKSVVQVRKLEVMELDSAGKPLASLPAAPPSLTPDPKPVRDAGGSPTGGSDSPTKAVEPVKPPEAKPPVPLAGGGAQKPDPNSNPLLDLSKLEPRKVYDLHAHQKQVNRVAFNFDGNLLASGGEDGKVIIWDMRTGERGEVFARPDFVGGLTFAPLKNSNTLVSARATPFGPGFCGAVTICNLETNETVEMLSRAKWSFKTLAVHRSGKLIAAGGADRALYVWDITTIVSFRKERDKQVPEYFEFTTPALPAPIFCLDFYPKPLAKPLLVAGCKDGSIELYQIAKPQADGLEASEIRIEKQVKPVHCVKFSPDGRLLATTGGDGMIRLRDAITGKLIRTIDTVNSPVNWLSFSPDSRLLADARDDKTVRLWNVETGKELSALREHTAPVYGVEFGPDGKRLASCDGNFSVLVWSLYPSEPAQKKSVGKKRRN